MYLDYAELQAIEEHPMKMVDWINQLDYFIKMNRKDFSVEINKLIQYLYTI